ncbi:MAG: NYN domain-containing protein [Acidimicrobiia bacterium]|nr:NYN domain-containing protein [Acidimicrobiia bacterium]
MSDQRLKIAVFIDFDNIEIGVKTTLNVQFDIGAVLEAVKERGEVVTKVAYGDWKRSGDHGRAMAQHAVRLVQRVMTPGGDKNGADINLALDALEMAFTHAHINAFVIVGGDSDFITLVEKLKQYDRKVFVVGGRAFTSQVMQKNCTEFIAYENIIPDPSTRSGSSRAQSRDDRGRPPKQASRPAGPPAGRQSIEQAEPLVMRALKVLADREVTPQLGLLKSTLLQLDSSFSERDYGAGTFREFADKLAKQGLVSLKHQGRSTLVELPGANEHVTMAPHPAPAEADASLGDASGGSKGARAVKRANAKSSEQH